MLKKTITYTDFNGVERTEDFFFNLSKAEIMEMELGVNGGFAEMLQKIIDAKDAPALLKEFKKLILKAYGIKSDDGKRFIKSESISEDFAQSEAYSVMFMEMITDPQVAAAFVNGIVPTDLRQEAPNRNLAFAEK